MDLEEWEILPDDGFLEIHDDGGKKIFSRKYYEGGGGGGDPNTNTVFKMNYFICPSPNSQKTHAHHHRPPPVNPIPIQLDHHQLVKEEQVNSKVPKAPNIGAVETDQETVSQVFFKKMKENEFVDMKMDSPKSGGRGIVPQPQIDAATKFQFEDTNTNKGEEAMKLELELELELEGKSGSEMRIEKENNMELDSEESGNGGINLWKWSLNGIGAICSFGVAAATICVVILGSHHKNNHHHHQQFQIYADQKRMKQVVEHATKFNEAMSAVRGVAVPLTVSRAHFTLGGYYDGL